MERCRVRRRFLPLLVGVLGIGLDSFVFAQDKEVTVPRVMVKLRISNPDQRPMKLLRVEGNERVEVGSLGGSKEESVSVESGVYVLAQSDPPSQGICWLAIPVPALGDALRTGKPDQSQPLELSVTMGKAPKSREGLCWIPGGPALIGDNLGVGQPDERPVRIVDVPGFWIGRMEVTNQEYADFLNDVGTFDAKWIDLENRTCLVRKKNDRYETDAKTLPVVTVTYAGALAFCQWRTKKTGMLHRLPSEVEWEKAARGPESFVFSYGNIYHPNAANQESGRVVAGGNFPPNSFGAYDMTGNVFEWVAPAENAENNTKGVFSHPLRGGSFVLDGMYLRNSFRMRQSPEVMADDIGFRVAVDDQPTDKK